jgi:hypothetical protein
LLSEGSEASLTISQGSSKSEEPFDTSGHVPCTPLTARHLRRGHLDVRSWRQVPPAVLPV